MECGLGVIGFRALVVISWGYISAVLLYFVCKFVIGVSHAKLAHLAAVKDHLVGWAVTLCPWLWKREDLYARRLRQLVKEVETARTRTLVKWLPPCLCVMLVLRLQDDTTASYWQNPDASLEDVQNVCMGRFGSALVALFVSSVWTAFPRTLNCTTMHIVQGYFLLSNVGIARLAPNFGTLMATLQTQKVMRIVLATFSGRTSWTLFFNLGCAVANFYLMMKRRYTDVGLDIPHPLHFDMVRAVVMEGLPVLLAVSTCHVLSSQTHKEVLARLVAAHAISSQHGVRGLLTVLCDADVRLDGNLRTLEHSPSLGSLLFISQGVPAGRNFMDFVLPADQERFQSFIDSNVHMAGASPATCGPVPALHLHLADINRCTVDVELFIGSSVDVIGRVTHHLGICEHSQGERQPTLARSFGASRSASRSSSGSKTSSFLFAAGKQCAEERSASKERSFDETFCAAVPAVPIRQSSSRTPLTTSKVYEVWVDPMSASLTVQKCTPDLAKLLGCEGEARFWDFAAKVIQADLLMRKLQQVVQDALYEPAIVEDKDAAKELGSFTLAPVSPSLRLYKVSCIADCSTLSVSTQKRTRGSGHVLRLILSSVETLDALSL
mmetsp:Transcript_28677/g.66123  ORF Transcript_28677/g.66123 Transcript_28677/m.66123 type:complete len:608 (-) Transcript_28677:62-1885(-)